MREAVVFIPADEREKFVEVKDGREIRHFDKAFDEGHFEWINSPSWAIEAWKEETDEIINGLKQEGVKDFFFISFAE
jgi:hypothetical protein